MGEHDSLGLSRCAGSEDDEGTVFGSTFRRKVPPFIFPEKGRRLLQADKPFHPGKAVPNGIDFLFPLFVVKEDIGVRAIDRIGQEGSREFRVEGHRHRTGAGGPQQHRSVFKTVPAEKCHVGGAIFLRQPECDTFRSVRCLTERNFADRPAAVFILQEGLFPENFSCLLDKFKNRQRGFQSNLRITEGVVLDLLHIHACQFHFHFSFCSLCLQVAFMLTLELIGNNRLWQNGTWHFVN